MVVVGAANASNNAGSSPVIPVHTVVHAAEQDVDAAEDPLPEVAAHHRSHPVWVLLRVARYGSNLTCAEECAGHPCMCALHQGPVLVPCEEIADDSCCCDRLLLESATDLCRPGKWEAAIWSIAKRDHAKADARVCEVAIPHEELPDPALVTAQPGQRARLTEGYVSPQRKGVN